MLKRSRRRGSGPATDATFFRIESAITCAREAADKFGLPQTVFLSPDTNGWWHTHSLARILSMPTTVVHVTMMPARYWS